MFSVLVAAFVVVCASLVITGSLYVMRQERRNRAYLDQQIEEDILAGVFDVVRMDVPGKYPALRTRNAKVLR